MAGLVCVYFVRMSLSAFVMRSRYSCPWCTMTTSRRLSNSVGLSMRRGSGGSLLFTADCPVSVTRGLGIRLRQRRGSQQHVLRELQDDFSIVRSVSHGGTATHRQPDVVPALIGVVDL